MSTTSWLDCPKPIQSLWDAAEAQGYCDFIYMPLSGVLMAHQPNAHLEDDRVLITWDMYGFKQPNELCVAPPKPYSRLIDERNIGTFTLSRELLADNDDALNLKLFGNFIIIRAEYMFATNAVEYTAYSPLFESVESSCMPPAYQVVIDGDGNVSAVKQ